MYLTVAENQFFHRGAEFRQSQKRRIRITHIRQSRRYFGDGFFNARKKHRLAVLVHEHSDGAVYGILPGFQRFGGYGEDGIGFWYGKPNKWIIGHLPENITFPAAGT